MKVKICGITNLEDALLAIDYQADALGFILHAYSPRAISLEYAVDIIQQLPPFVSKVALVVNASTANIQRIIDTHCFNIIQFHGDESTEFCQQFNFSFIKCLRVKANESIIKKAHACIRPDRHYMRGFLIDKWHKQAYGGRGELLKNAELNQLKLPLPVILAGGLTIQNVQKQIQLVQPYAVDVSSGVEISKGKKCPKKLKLFIHRAKQT